MYTLLRVSYGVLKWKRKNYVFIISRYNHVTLITPRELWTHAVVEKLYIFVVIIIIIIIITTMQTRDFLWSPSLVGNTRPVVDREKK
jgi:hypothetical protein